jgi:hypothetical protein
MHRNTHLHTHTHRGTHTYTHTQEYHYAYKHTEKLDTLTFTLLRLIELIGYGPISKHRERERERDREMFDAIGGVG